MAATATLYPRQLTLSSFLPKLLRLQTPVVESGGETRLELPALARTLLRASPESLIKRTFAILSTKISEELPQKTQFLRKILSLVARNARRYGVLSPARPSPIDNKDAAMG